MLAPTVIYGIPTFYEKLLKLSGAGKEFMKSAKFAVSFGSSASADISKWESILKFGCLSLITSSIYESVKQTFGLELIQGYGSTESGNYLFLALNDSACTTCVFISETLLYSVCN